MNKCDCGAIKANTSHAHWCSSLLPEAKTEESSLYGITATSLDSNTVIDSNTILPLGSWGGLSITPTVPNLPAGSSTVTTPKSYAEELKELEKYIDELIVQNKPVSIKQYILNTLDIYSRHGVHVKALFISYKNFNALDKEMGYGAPHICITINGINVHPDRHISNDSNAIIVL